jgi:hypothetical protein
MITQQTSDTIWANVQDALDADPKLAERWIASAPGAVPEPEVGQTPATEAVPPYPSVSADPRPVLCISRGAGERGRQ